VDVLGHALVGRLDSGTCFHFQEPLLEAGASDVVRPHGESAAFEPG
jgi:hypothetical protein